MKLVIILSLLLTTGCSTMKDSVFAGAAIGATAGGALGNSQRQGKHRQEATVNGALIGAVLGSAIGYFGYKDKLKKSKKLRVTRALKKEKNTNPLLTKPKVKRVWVEDKVIGRRFIKGHWEFVIEENSRWDN